LGRSQALQPAATLPCAAAAAGAGVVVATIQSAPMFLLLSALAGQLRATDAPAEPAARSRQQKRANAEAAALRPRRAAVDQAVELARAETAPLRLRSSLHLRGCSADDWLSEPGELEPRREAFVSGDILPVETPARLRRGRRLRSGRVVLATALLAVARACTYDQQNGASCVPLTGSVGDAGDAPGGVTNLGDGGTAATFAVLSDWGGNDTSTTTPAQLAAAKALSAVCAANSCKAVLSAGNNFRPSGLPAGAAVASARFNETWRDVYGDSGAPWYVTGGPDDWAGNVTGERAASQSSGSGFSWHYPDLWQSIELVVPPGYGTLQVLLLDTVTLLGSMGGATRRLADFNSLDDVPPQSQLQWQWVEAQLAACAADWLVVIGSSPLLSAGPVGPSAMLQQRLLPLLNASGAALYIGGQDAVAQHFRPIAAAPLLDSIVVGNGAGGDAAAAAALPHAADVPPGSLAWSFGGSAGFATLSVGLDSDGEAQMTVSFYGESESALLYSFTKNATRRGSLSLAPPVGGPHGARSGLLMLLILAGGTAAGGGYLIAQAMHPPALLDEPPAPRPRRKAAEKTPLVEAGLTEAERAKRFSVFTL